MDSYKTLSAAIAALKERGYNTLFHVEQGCLSCLQTQMRLAYTEINVDEVYWIEDEGDNCAEAVVYAISSSQKSMKGIWVSPIVEDGPKTN